MDLLSENFEEKANWLDTKYIPKNKMDSIYTKKLAFKKGKTFKMKSKALPRRGSVMSKLQLIFKTIRQEDLRIFQ